MLKKLAKCVREYKLATILTLIFIVCEVVIEIFIPFMTAKLITNIQLGKPIEEILKIGGILVLMAAASLTCGGIAGVTCAKASAGFAKNVRHDVFSKIQTYSFENIDRFSSTSLVTRRNKRADVVHDDYKNSGKSASYACILHSYGDIHGRTFGCYVRRYRSRAVWRSYYGSEKGYACI